MQHTWILAVFISSSLILSGCQSFKPKAIKLPENNQAQTQFNLQGKIGVRTPQQSGSAFFSWAQQDDQFAIELTGILGVGKTQIEGKLGQVTLNSAKTGVISAATPEELLARATGWQAPITHLVSWVQARPATTQAQVKQDAAGRINQIIEDGWDVSLSYAGDEKLPNKLVMVQNLTAEQNNPQQNRITMLIQSR